MITKLHLIIFSIIEAIYVIYVLRFFKTRKSLDYGYVIKKLSFLRMGKYIEHPTREYIEPKSMICPFGHDLAFLLGGYLIIRFLLGFKMKTIIILNFLILALSFIMSFMNFNAVIYLLPFIIVDLLFNLYLLKNMNKIKLNKGNCLK